MRVNHMGEVCAQALYRGQALTTTDSSITIIIKNMCIEEKNHLNMLSERLSELSGRTSRLNSLWYLSSFMLGAYVGTLDKNKSYGFIYETETQVEDHLDEYSQKLPATDVKSKKILEEIKIDETKHKNTAKDQGSIDLSKSTKNLMSMTSKIMKKKSKSQKSSFRKKLEKEKNKQKALKIVMQEDKPNRTIIFFPQRW